MRYWTRKSGSQRASKPVTIEFAPNSGGQGGWPYMTFKVGEVWHVIEPETLEDVRILQSQSAILALNVKDK